MFILDLEAREIQLKAPEKASKKTSVKIILSDWFVNAAINCILVKNSYILCPNDMITAKVSIGSKGAATHKFSQLL